MSPDEKSGNGGESDQRPDETEEHDHQGGEEPNGVYDGHQDLEQDEAEEEPEAEEDLEGEGEFEDEEDSELDELISAETQEWDSIEAVEDDGGEDEEDEGDEDGEEEEAAEEDHEVEGEEEEAAQEEPAHEEQPTLVASAGARLGEARSKISSGFEGLRDRDKVGSGVAKVRGWRPSFPLWLRFTTASLSIIASVAAATAASLILYLGDIANALQDTTGVLQGADKFLTRVDAGGPQTILILGSDKRPEDKGGTFRGLSDTTMLLRLDPDRNAIALFSLPRDLQVVIPGRGTAKLNEAYAYGGPQLTLQTVEELLSDTGRPFEVNHLVNVDFEGFARAVNEIDCVYVDVDRRYFNTNDDFGEDYEEIDIQPGYQALCGFDALDYARYRHTDNDIVRAARQQEFLREARSKVPPQKLFEDRKDLIAIFTEHTTSDISDPQTMLQVLKLFLDARDAPIKEVHFEGTLGPSFVTTTTQELRKAVNQFFGFQATGGGGQSAAPEAGVTPDVAPDEAPVAPAGKGAAAPAPKALPPETGGSVEGDFGVTQTDFGQQLAKAVRARVAKLPIFYPSVLETGSDFDQKPRVYKVNGTGEGSPPGTERAAYKWVISRPALGEYYGFMATRWRDPPILEDPDTTRMVGDREYKIYFDGDRVRMVAWQDDQGSYWLTNTLVESLSDREMLAIAKGIKELPRAAAPTG